MGSRFYARADAIHDAIRLRYERRLEHKSKVSIDAFYGYGEVGRACVGARTARAAAVYYIPGRNVDFSNESTTHTPVRQLVATACPTNRLEGQPVARPPNQPTSTRYPHLGIWRSTVTAD